MPILHLTDNAERYVPSAVSNPIHIPIAGFYGLICSACYNNFTISISPSERPEAQLRLTTPSHYCKGEKKFDSDLARKDEEIKSRIDLMDSLFKDVKNWLRDKNIEIKTEKLDYIPEASVQKTSLGAIRIL